MLSEMSAAAKGLARNPLGVIALFIVLIYGLASFVLGGSNALSVQERMPLVWFMVVYPVLVLGAFCWLVSQHYEKLYAPKDYSSDDAFLRGTNSRAQFRRNVIAAEQEVQSKVQQTLSSPEFGASLGQSGNEQLKSAVVELKKVIREKSNITINTEQFPSGDVFAFPIAAFPALGDLLDEVWSLIRAHVRPYEYGHSWVLVNKRTNSTVRGSRMITGSPPGAPISDVRSLSEVGIEAGDELEVIPLATQKKSKRGR